MSLSKRVTRFVALPHTEGCGSSGAEDLYSRVVLGHVLHPAVSHCVLLEHGCEKHHNDSVRADMAGAGVDETQFGWASVQLNGGIESVARRVERMFERAVMPQEAPRQLPAQPSLAGVSIAVIATEAVPSDVGACFAAVVSALLRCGADVVLPETATFLRSSWFLDELLETRDVSPSLHYGQRPPSPTPPGAKGAGQLHVMECPTSHWVEAVVGLASTGAQLVLAYSRRPRQGHPMVPTLCVADAAVPDGASPADAVPPYRDIDVLLPRADAGTAKGVPDDAVTAVWARKVLNAVMDVANRDTTPAALTTGNVDFQISRGRMGVSV